MAETGRPKVLTPKLQKDICDAIKIGNYMEVAAAYCGVNKETFYDWMRRGAKYNRGEKAWAVPENEIYAAFSVALGEALAESEVRDMVHMNAHAAKNWQAAAWKLERRFGKRWGRKDTIDIEHSGKIETEVSAKDTLLSKLNGLLVTVTNIEKGGEVFEIEAGESGESEPTE